MRMQAFLTSDLQAVQPDHNHTYPRLDRSIDLHTNTYDGTPLNNFEQAPSPAGHVHIVINNGLVHIHGDDGSSDQQRAVVQAVYDLIGITDPMPMPTAADSLSATEICATITAALRHVPGLDIQQVHVQVQGGAIVLQGITPER